MLFFVCFSFHCRLRLSQIIAPTCSDIFDGISLVFVLEPTVRAELMEQVPNIAMFLHESRPNFPAAFSRYLVPIVVRYLTDPNNQVGLSYYVRLH